LPPERLDLIRSFLIFFFTRSMPVRCYGLNFFIKANIFISIANLFKIWNWSI
jgi:hypothetical protein